MSFDGDLEHLPIVDVIQLLHATSKSGTLTLRSLKGESQLVFHSGYIVSVNHVNNSVRIGQVLLDMGVISYEELEAALHEQQRAGANRKPIVQTLVEAGKLRNEDAYQGMEVLIEMTIVEVLTWTRGTFSLDVDKLFVSDEFRYFPEHLDREIQLNTQSVLMDALRIYDEKKRDGTLDAEPIFAPPPALNADGSEISAADLGLDDLDLMERKLPQQFTGLADSAPLPDTPRSRLAPFLSGIPAEEQARLFSYLEGLAGASGLPGDGTGVLLCTADKVLRECVAAACGPHFRIATDDPSGLPPMIEQSLARGVHPLVVFDPGEPGARAGGREGCLPLLQGLKERYPELDLLLLACPGDYRLGLEALKAGVQAVLPRASREERAASYVADAIDCTDALGRHLRNLAQTRPAQGMLQKFKELVLALSDKREPPEVTALLMQGVSLFFQRAVTLVVVRNEAIAERGIGIGDGPGLTSVRVRHSLAAPSLLKEVVDGGASYFGMADQALRDTLFAALGAPASPKVLLLPVKSFGRVIALIYGDFGIRAGGSPQPELLDMLALEAGLVIDNALYRKRCAQKTG